jgi:uncharacterized membrane protein YGL010W
MRTFDQWMAEYGVSHQNPTNQIVHKVCVPLITLSVVGFLWAIPVPESFHSIPYLNWASIFVLGCLVFYLSLNFMMFLGMLIQTFTMLWISSLMDRAGILLPASAIIFVGAWAGQFWGHKVEGKKPSFLQDLAFLLIGPLWVLRFLYAKLGIKV